jgi:hypothetical protein
MKKWILSILFVVGVTLAAVWAISRLIGTSQAEQPKAQMSAVVSQAQEDLQTQLMDPKLDLQSREMLIEKIELENRVAANQKSGEEKPAPKTQANQIVAAAAPEQLQVETGIFEGSEGMVRPEKAAISNYWRGVLNEKIYIAFAGSKAGDDKQGMIVLVTTSQDPAVNDINFEDYFAPVNGGQLRVMEAKDGVLVLQQASGALIKFDLNKRVFTQ